MKKNKIFKILFLVIVLYWLYALYSMHIVYYSGYVYEGDRPLAGVKVIEGERDNPVYTDNKGYFKLRKKESAINNYLIFTKENFKTDTVFLTPMGGGHRKIEYLFLRKEKDTLKMNKIAE